MKNRGNVSVANLLESDNGLGVLESQRNFAWGKDEAEEFFDDLRQHTEEGKDFFLGTVVINTGDPRSHERELIVDGQQRITTINLFLIACRQRAKEIGDGRLASRIQQKIYVTESLTGNDVTCRFEASPSINDVFQHIAKYDWSGELPAKIGKVGVKKQARLVSPVYSYFQSRLSQLGSEEVTSMLRALLDTTQVARIDVADNAEALAIFERVNARGLQLVISDLLKNELFSKIPDAARESWGSVVENSGGSTERMLKYFYVSRNGYVQKKDLFRKLKELSKETGTTEFLRELEDYSVFYKIVRSGSKEDLKAYLEEKGLLEISGYQYRYEAVHASLEGLRLFKITQFYPVLYSAVMSLVRNSLQESVEAAKNFVHLVAMLENYHFVNNMICERGGNEVEKPYADLASKFWKTGFVEAYKHTVAFIRETKAKKEEFVPRFADTWYTFPDTIPQLMYIFDRFSNEGVDSESKIRLFNPELLKKRNQNIEHFYPRNPSAELQEVCPKPENLDNIGNLLAISFRVNSSLQNKSPEEKVKLLEGKLARQIQNHIFVRDFLDEYGPRASKWCDEEISDRAIAMAKKAYDVIWRV